MLILFMLFNFNDAGVKLIVFEITGYEIANLYVNTVLAILGGFIGIVLFTEFLTKRLSIQIILKELFTLAVLAIIFSSSSLIWGFSIYFILWQSFLSLVEQISFIYGDLNTDSSLKYFT